MTIAEKITRAKTDYDEVYHAGKLAVLKSSEVLHGTASGETIAVHDVNPVEHSLGVKVASKNIYNASVTSRVFKERHNGGLWNGAYGTQDDITSLRGKTITYQAQVDFTNTIETTAKFRVRIWWYGEDKEYLNMSSPREIYNTDNGIHISSITATIPQDARYAMFGVEFCFNELENALEGSSVTISNPMVEIGTTATAYTPHIADISGVEVSKIGKNLWDGTVNLLEGLSNNNGVFVQTNVDTKSYLHFVMQTYDGITYNQFYSDHLYNPTVVSGTFTKRSNTNLLRVGHNGSSKNVMSWFDISNLIDGQTYTIQANITNVTQGTFSWQDIQIELGSTATEYEPYISPQTATANAEGVVEGLTSLSPNMTLMTDTEGVMIDLEYYRDIDLAFENLMTEIALSGGE